VQKPASDVIITGGGLAGLSMACILGHAGFTVTCIDREDPEKTLSADFDGRTTAISSGSSAVLQRTGIWEKILPKGCPIKDIHITDNGSPLLLQFLADDVHADAFGWIFENITLRKSLIEEVRGLKNITHLAPCTMTHYTANEKSVDVHLENGETITAPLLIGADGRPSATRKMAGIPSKSWSYHQRAVICNVLHENPHNNVAVEDFRDEGPFAVLPMADTEDGKHRSGIVWTEHGAEEDSALHWDADTFNKGLQERFPDWYGTVEACTKPQSYPLSLIHARSYIAPRMALIADAAHGIHPIAGQGLNLGYRDIDELADLLIAAKAAGDDLGGDALLRTYQKKRKLDNTIMAVTTDLLVRLFSNKITPLRIARKIGLKAVQKIGPARKFFMRQAMGRD
jgi:2-octaprenyl-6-methoxyphenol hydroxylase